MKECELLGPFLFDLQPSLDCSSLFFSESTNVGHVAGLVVHHVGHVAGLVVRGKRSRERICSVPDVPESLVESQRCFGLGFIPFLAKQQA